MSFIMMCEEIEVMWVRGAGGGSREVTHSTQGRTKHSYLAVVITVVLVSSAQS